MVTHPKQLQPMLKFFLMDILFVKSWKWWSWPRCLLLWSYKCSPCEKIKKLPVKLDVYCVVCPSKISGSLVKSGRSDPTLQVPLQHLNILGCYQWSVCFICLVLLQMEGTVSPLKSDIIAIIVWACFTNQKISRLISCILRALECTTVYIVWRRAC